jgi:pimeloyl-ACP methyl ester carboxylesterase
MSQRNASGTPSGDGKSKTAQARSGGNGRIRVPTLFIFGEQDFAILPATVRGIGNYIDASYCELRIADSGHWVQNEAAAEVNAALLEFLEAT